MGKKAPKAPDPKETASAQTATNIGTAIANSYLGNINQVTPDGTLTYTQSGTQHWRDPLDGKVYEIPLTTATQTLSAQQQAIKNQSDAAELNLAKLANSQSGRLNDVLANPVDTSKLPAWGDPSKIGLPNYTQFGSGPNLQTSLGNSGSIQTGLANAGNVQKTIANAGNIQSSLGNMGDIQSALGNSGDITGQIANAGNIQKALGDTGTVQTGLGDAGALTRSYGTDYSADRQKVEDALMARMNPQLEQNRAALEQRLANQGLQPGSEAYNRAVDEANRTATDARYGAILNAGQEQSRLAGLARDAAMFENSAQQQAYNQMLASGQFANAAQAQQMQNALASGQFANTAQAQQYSQNANDAQFANQAQQQKFTQGLAGAEFANNAQQQRYNQGLSSAQFGNQAQAQQYSQNANDAQFGNQAQQQQFGQNLAGAQFGNAAQQQKFTQGLAGAEFGNNAAQQMFANQNSATAANNALQDQGFNSQMAKMNAQNQQRQAQLQEMFALRNAPINETSALLAGSQVSNPQFMNIQGQTMPTVDYAGLVNSNYAQQMQAYQANQSALGGLLGGIGSLFSLSDDNAKKNKTRHGDVKDRMGLWTYNYKGEPAGTPKHVGLMASEVEKKVPSAIKRRNGLRYVNYEKALGGR